jgi:LysM repeat protein
VDYAASIAQRTAAAPTGTQGAFRNGATTGASYSDFDQSYNPINSYEQGANAGVYTVRKGDTLQGIAAGLYGDASLWYKIAEINGLSGQTALIEGQSLTLPAGVIRNTNNASTFRPYDPFWCLIRRVGIPQAHPPFPTTLPYCRFPRAAPNST